MSATRILVSVDTEEDNWKPTRSGISVENVRALPEFNDFLIGLDLRPTYFVDHPVATEPWAAEILRGIREQRSAEIGAHLHPWNTPPIEESFTPRNRTLWLPTGIPARSNRSQAAAASAVSSRG